VNAYERKIEILKMLEKEGKVQIKELSDLFSVTKVTIRNDLEDLEKRGLLVRTHGGALLAENKQLIRFISKTIHEMEREKESIAREATRLITPSSTIMIDSGSTTAFLPRFIRDTKLTVITNSLLVMEELSGASNIELLVSGGALRRSSMALIGDTARFFFNQINADLLFLGATAMSLNKGVSCSNLVEASTKRLMIESSERICLLADSSKLGKVAMAHICNWDDIDILITDSMPREDRRVLMEFGVEVIITKSQGG